MAAGGGAAVTGLFFVSFSLLETMVDAHCCVREEENHE